MNLQANWRLLTRGIDEEVSTAALRNVVKPWKGVVITFTGVERKVGGPLSASDIRTETDLRTDTICGTCR